MSGKYKLKFHKTNILSSDFSSYVLGVDIGGTNTNFGIAGIKDNKPFLLFSLQFKSQELSSLIPAIFETLDYAKNEHNIEISDACIGAAGAVSPANDYADLTNVKWDVDAREILDKTPLQTTFIINDFQAIGYGVNLLDSSNNKDIFPVKKGSENDGSSFETQAIIGAGTGLGKSILSYDTRFQAYIPIPSEGGHGDFPAQNDFEITFLDFIKEKRKIYAPVSYEDLLSGNGIEMIYTFLRQSKAPRSSQFTNEIDQADEKPVLISKYKDIDETCKKTFQLFSMFYGRCAKNFVLDTLAKGGLYIAGGIASKNKEIFSWPEFRTEFENTYKRTDILRNTPVYVIVNYDVSLYGACFAAMYNRHQKKRG